ncbi:plasmid mobilization protein [Vibrio campbellii]
MNKNTTINLRISADDKAELQRRAKEMKLSLSTFLVLRGLGYV